MAGETKPELLAPLTEAGFTLIPLRSRGKVPTDANWTRRAYDGFDAVGHMERGGNVGVRLRPCDLVVDVDPRNFSDGDDPVARLRARLGLDTSDWPSVETGSGGQHYYLSKPPGEWIVGGLSEFPGIEFKTAGRQVVAPGSVHPDTGRTYEWAANAEDLWCAPEAPPALLHALRRPAVSEASDGGEHSAEEVARMLGALDPGDFRDHSAWLQLMQACHHASGGDARDEFVSWSTGDPEYADHDEIVGRRWDSLRADGKGERVTHRTLYKLLSDAGRADAIPPRADAADDFGGENELTEADLPDEGQTTGALIRRGLAVGQNGVARDTFANSLAAVGASRLGLAFDELKQRTVFTGPALPWDEAYGRTLDDHTARLLRHYLIAQHQRSDFQPSKENVWEAAMTLAYEAKFNPVLDYLDGVEWDRVPRVERLFPAYFDTEDDEYTRAVSRCFMVAAVRRQRRPGCKFDTMPVLRSREQGKGKSTGVRALFSDDWFSDADLGDIKNKDAALLLQGVWVQEFAELDGLRRAEVNTLKAFCSRGVDRLRPPYGKGVSDMPRRTVFVGTVNEGGYLKDGTGNRRFWPLTVRGEVDVAALLRDRDQLWAEASALEASGAETVLPRDLWALAGEKQAEQTSDDPWADTIRAFIEQRAENELDAALEMGEYAPGEMNEGLDAPPAGRVHTTELLDALDLPQSRRTKDVAQKVRTIMEGSLGWTYVRSLRVGRRVAAGYRLD